MKIKTLIACLLCFFTLPAHAELEIDITGATREPMPIAFPELIDNTTFRLLNIAEFYNHVTDNNYKL
jgi:hypothetical protein